jgi:hypothetical protein
MGGTRFSVSVRVIASAVKSENEPLHSKLGGFGVEMAPGTVSPRWQALG